MPTRLRKKIILPEAGASSSGFLFSVALLNGINILERKRIRAKSVGKKTDLPCVRAHSVSLLFFSSFLNALNILLL